MNRQGVSTWYTGITQSILIMRSRQQRIRSSVAVGGGGRRGTYTLGHTKISHKEDCCEKAVTWNACFLPHPQPATALLSGRSVETHDNEIYLTRSYSSTLHFIYCNLMGLASKLAICVLIGNDNKITMKNLSPFQLYLLQGTNFTTNKSHPLHDHVCS